MRVRASKNEAKIALKIDFQAQRTKKSKNDGFQRSLLRLGTNFLRFLDDYRAIFLKKKRISDGKKFIQNNITVLEKAEKEFGVPKEVITAILGVETDYGNIMGSYRVSDSLTTLGFDDPRRSKFFKSVFWL